MPELSRILTSKASKASTLPALPRMMASIFPCLSPPLLQCPANGGMGASGLIKKIPCSVFLTLIFGFAHAATGESRLETLKNQKDAAVQRAVAPIEERYVAELEDFLKILTSSSQLEKALEVKKAIERAGDGDLEGDVEVKSERLALLRAQRKDAIERAKAPIEATYLNELEKLLRKATSASRLEKAVEIKNELAQFRSTVRPLGEEVEREEFSEETLLGTEWVLEQGGEQVMFRFGEGKFQVHHLDANDNWEVGGHRNWRMENAKRRQIRIFWNYGEEVATINARMTEMKDPRHVMKRLESEDSSN